MVRRLTLMLLMAPATLHAQTPVAQTSGAQPAGAIALLGPALHVASVERSLAFYVKALGMRVNLQMGPAGDRETMLGFGPDANQAAIILLSDETGAKPQAIAHTHGFDRLVLRVSDLPAVVTRLRAAGYTATDVRDVAQGYRMAMATDPDGYRLELVERAGTQEKAR